MMGQGGLSEEVTYGSPEGRKGALRTRPATLQSTVSLNPPARWVSLSRCTDEEAQRHALTCSRSHSSMCWHEIQTQLCFPVLGYSPLAQKSTSPPKNVDVTKPGGAWWGAAGVIGLAGYV